MTTLLRTGATAILTLYLGFGDLSAAQAGAKPAATARNASARFKSPFKKGLSPLAPSALVSLGGREHVDANQYRDLAAAGQHLLTLYPAHSHYFVGLGRDGTPLIAFLQNLGGKELAINFPASSNESSRATQEVLATYVNKLIPESVLASGRTIVFVDATTSGRALNLYVPRIAPSLRGAKVIQAPFAVQYNGHSNWPIFTSPGVNQVIHTHNFPEVNRFFTEPYEDVVGEYPRHGPGTHDISVLDSPLPQYQRYRDALMQRMQRDEGLHSFLKTQAGPAFASDKSKADAE